MGVWSKITPCRELDDPLCTAQEKNQICHPDHMFRSILRIGYEVIFELRHDCKIHQTFKNGSYPMSSIEFCNEAEMEKYLGGYSYSPIYNKYLT